MLRAMARRIGLIATVPSSSGAGVATGHSPAPAGRPDLISLVRGAEAVAERAMTFRRFAETSTRILANETLGGVAWAPGGSPFAVLAVTVRGGKIVRIDVLADPDRVDQLDLTVVAG